MSYEESANRLGCAALPACLVDVDRGVSRTTREPALCVVGSIKSE